MYLFVTGVTAGIFGTLMMDFFNHLLSRAGVLLKIDIAILGRMSAGWVRGRFSYHHPGEIEKAPNERLLGYITHYTISIIFALAYVFGWALMIGGPASPLWALVFGAATTAASQFLVFPSMGLGVFGKRSPEGLRAPLSSLVNHFFFGAGLAVVVTLFNLTDNV